MIILHDFTGIYRKQEFYKTYSHLLMDHTQLSGVRGYMDESAKHDLSEKIKDWKTFSKIHFLDSGNYHHLSYLYITNIKEPFSLVVFDNHTDMQPSAFGEILSCGSWIAETLANPYLQSVTLIGVKNEYREECRFQEDERVFFMSSVQDADHLSNIPIYLSIDKDVLSEGELLCDWDQGEMKLSALLSQVEWIKNNHRLLGVDICGEPNLTDESILLKSNRVNQALLDLFSGFLWQG